MPKQDAYHQWLKEDLGALIDALELPGLQKHFLRSRWLDQILWMEGKANGARSWYSRLRLTTIIGGIIIPALISLTTPGITILSLDGGPTPAVGWITVIGWITFVLSILVGISAAVEQFFSFGERWRHYRRMVETLKVEGWQFFQLTGPYRRYESHADAYREFAARTEETNQHDVESYIANVVREKEKDSEEKAGQLVARPGGQQGTGDATAAQRSPLP
jgi:Protein of unknown function (DUF4231)